MGVLTCFATDLTTDGVGVAADRGKWARRGGPPLSHPYRKIPCESPAFARTLANECPRLTRQEPALFETFAGSRADNTASSTRSNQTNVNCWRTSSRRRLA